MTTGYTHFSIDAIDNQYASLPKYQDNETTLPLPAQSAVEDFMRPILPPARHYDTEESSGPSRPGHEYTKKKQKGRKRKLKHKTTGGHSDINQDVVNPSIFQGDSIPPAPPGMLGPSKVPSSGSVFNAFNHPNYNRTTRSQGAIPANTQSQGYQVQGRVTTPQTARSAPASILRPAPSNFSTSYQVPFGRYMVPSQIQQSLMIDSRHLHTPAKQPEKKQPGKLNISYEKPSSSFNVCYRSTLFVVICLFIASIITAAVFAAMPI